MTPSLLELKREGETRTLAPRVMDLLERLAERRGHVVTKEELHESVWGGRAVGEDVQRRAVSELRRALGDDATSPRWVHTVPRRGYRLAPERPESASGRGSASGGTRLILGAVTVLLAAVFALMWWPGQGAFPGPEGPVRVVSNRPLTSMPGWEDEPALSPDGRRLAFLSSSRSEEPVAKLTGSTLYVQEVSSASAEPWTDGESDEAYPSWSPDGERLAWVRFEGRGARLLARSLAEAEAEVLATWDDIRILGLDWLADGSGLVLSMSGPAAGGERTPALYTLDLGSGTTTRISDPPEGVFGDLSPAVSPDGDRVAFVRVFGEGIHDLYLADLGADPGSAEPRTERLTTDGAKIPGLDWSRDGGLIFSRYGNDGPPLWRWSFESARAEVLAAPFPRHKPLRLAAGGAAVAVVNASSDSELVRTRLEGEAGADGKAEVLFPSTAWDVDPDLAADGRSLAFASARSGAYEIWTATLGEADPVQRTEMGGPITLHPSWSPDGRRIAFDSRPGGHADIYVLDVEGEGAPRRLTEHPAQDVRPFWSPDGREVFFASNRDGDWQIWRQAVDGSEPAVRLTSGGGYRAAIDRGSGELIFSPRGRSGLWRMRPEPGAPERRWLAPRPGEIWLGWSATDGDILISFVGGRGPGWLSLPRGEEEPRPRPAAPWLTSRADFTFVTGGPVIFERTRLEAADLVLLELGRAAAAPN